MTELLNPMNESMTAQAYWIVFVCFVCNMLDGMDVLIISYTAPAIAKAWSISPANLGIVFSSGLIGMTVGAIFLAPLADKFGRKPMMLLAAGVMGTCIYITSYAQSTSALLLYRFISGLGIGVMMVNTASITAEYTPTKTRDFWVSLVITGYPVGAVLTGIFSVSVIQNGWQRMYEYAGFLSLSVLPVIYFLLKESQDFRINAKPETAQVKTLFIPDLKWGTAQLWTALFLSFSTLYFLMNWIPKLATNAGLSMQSAIYAGTVFNMGAIVGIPVQGYFSSKVGLKKTITTILLATAVLLLCFQFFIGSAYLMVILFLLGFGVQGGFVGLYAMSARMYPTAFRSTGIGWALGIGRLGGIIGPIVGGYLVTLGLGMEGSFMVFAIPSLLAGLSTWKISSPAIS